VASGRSSEALELDPRSAETHAIKSKILWRQGRQDEAFAEIEVALRLDPDSFEANRTAGLWNMRTRRFARPSAITKGP
jgi:adenylate cyclase